MQNKTIFIKGEVIHRTGLVKMSEYFSRGIITIKSEAGEWKDKKTGEVYKKYDHYSCVCMKSDFVEIREGYTVECSLEVSSRVWEKDGVVQTKSSKLKDENGVLKAVDHPCTFPEFMVSKGSMRVLSDNDKEAARKNNEEFIKDIGADLEDDLPF